MKKFCILFAVVLILIVAVAVTARPQGAETAYLRMHVRANSDAACDQAVKYEVKDAVVGMLMPVAASCTGREQAMERVEALLSAIEEEAERVLAENGFSYGARAQLRREEFPARVYEGVTLEAGVYDALIVELGEGAGANWWCVLYPPLCFSAEPTGENIVYRSRIFEIIRGFFAD